MNFFLSFLQSARKHPIPAYSFWEFYVKNGIRESGHEWVEAKVDWAEGLLYTNENEKLEKWKSTVWEETISFIKKNHVVKPITCFISYLYPHQIDEQAIMHIKQMGIPCVNFFCDNVREFTKAPKEFAAFDINWVPEYKAIKLYRDAGYKYLHLPMPTWVDPKYRQISQVENSMVSFIGSKDIQRQMLFEVLVNKGIDVKIYGSGWRENENGKFVNSKNKASRSGNLVKNQFSFVNRFGLVAYWRKMNNRIRKFPVPIELAKSVNGPIDFDNYISITKNSMITLGVNRYPSFLFPAHRPNTYSRLRDIEAPMLGACYLTEWTDGLDEMYDIGNEIEVYKTNEELIEKIDALAGDKVKRDKMRLSAQKRALQCHSIQRSLNEIKKRLNG